MDIELTKDEYVYLQVFKYNYPLMWYSRMHSCGVIKCTFQRDNHAYAGTVYSIRIETAAMRIDYLTRIKEWLTGCIEDVDGSAGWAIPDAVRGL